MFPLALLGAARVAIAIAYIDYSRGCLVLDVIHIGPQANPSNQSQGGTVEAADSLVFASHEEPGALGNQGYSLGMVEVAYAPDVPALPSIYRLPAAFGRRSLQYQPLR
jgi:hypothetical protein